MLVFARLQEKTQTAGTSCLCLRGCKKKTQTAGIPCLCLRGCKNKKRLQACRYPMLVFARLQEKHRLQVCHACLFLRGCKKNHRLQVFHVCFCAAARKTQTAGVPCLFVFFVAARKITDCRCAMFVFARLQEKHRLQVFHVCLFLRGCKKNHRLQVFHVCLFLRGCKKNHRLQVCHVCFCTAARKTQTAGVPCLFVFAWLQEKSQTAGVPCLFVFVWLQKKNRLQALHDVRLCVCARKTKHGLQVSKSLLLISKYGKYASFMIIASKERRRLQACILRRLLKTADFMKFMKCYFFVGGFGRSAGGLARVAGGFGRSPPTGTTHGVFGPLARMREKHKNS